MNLIALFKKKLYFCVFVFILFSATISKTIIAQNNFVYTKGKNFMLNGKPYYFSGTNVYDLFTYGSSSGDIESEYMDKTRTDAHMKELYKNGVRVVRLWGFSHEVWHGFESEKGVYNESQFSLFDYIIKSAESNGIRLIIALENYWNDYGGIKARLEWEGIKVSGGGTHDQGQFFTNEKAIEGYKNYVKYFLTRKNHYDGVEYRNDPTILGWELMNEPRYQGFGDDLSSEVLTKWVHEMGEFVKSIDSNHLLSTGLEGHGEKYKFGGNEGNDFIKIHESSFIDFTSAHPYFREDWSNFDVQMAKDLVCQWADESHNILNKPFFMGEFNVEQLERKEWWEDFCDFIIEKEIGGSAFWWFPDNKTPRDKFAVFSGDDELKVFEFHSKLTEEKSGGEANAIALINPKSGNQYISGSDITVETNLLNKNNTVSKVNFYLNEVLVGVDNDAPYQFTLKNIPNGDHLVKAEAIGISGISKETNTHKIKIGGEVVSLLYKEASGMEKGNTIKPHFQLFNNSSVAIPYKDLSIKYWFTIKGNSGVNFFSEYSEIGTQYVKGKFTNTGGANYYMEITFDTAAVSLNSKENSGVIQTKIAKKDWSNLDQLDDYSYNGSFSQGFSVWKNVTVYYQGNLLFGVEPNDVGGTLAVSNFTNNRVISFSAQEILDNPLNSNLNYSEFYLYDLSGRIVVYISKKEKIIEKYSMINKGIYIAKLLLNNKSYTKLVPLK